MIEIFTPSFADEADSNAQNLSVKEIVARLDPAQFAVTMLHDGALDPRIAARPNTRPLRWRKHGNTARGIIDLLTHVPDIYFFPREGPLDTAFLKLRRTLKLRTKLVTYVVSGGLYLQPYASARQRNIREADTVVANNTYLAQLLKEKMGVEAVVIHSGIDTRYFFSGDNRGSASASFAVLYAGSMRTYKCVPSVVRHAARWPNVQFRIAGIGEEEQLCRRLAAELKCSNVEFLGHLSLARLGEEMRRASIFFFPSTTEGHPQVLGQAAACGLPVVVRKIYQPDYVVDGTTGLLADSEDELAAHLETLICQPELRNKMSAAAIIHSRRFNWDEIAHKWEEVFAGPGQRRKH